MTAPKRWLDDPALPEDVRAVLREAPGARALDERSRRRLSAKLARGAALPALAAGWLAVKSAAAALGVVAGTAALASSLGLIDAPRFSASPPASAPARAVRAPRPVLSVAEPAALAPAAPEPALLEPLQVTLAPQPALPMPSVSGSLSAESALLEQARGEIARAPAEALRVAALHAQRFPAGQLSAERTLIRIDALRRLGRQVEARELARGLLAGSSGGLYAERVRGLLGESAAP